MVPELAVDRSLELVVVAESGAEGAIRDIPAATIDQELPSGVLLVTIPVRAFDSLTSIPSVQSVSFRDRMEIMQ